MPRFVILEHDHPFLHWDLMLEVGGKLRTWRLSAAPAAGTQVSAEPLGDHRIAYLDYEGPVSGGRGSVVRWDSGSYELSTGTEVGDHFLIRLHGLRLQARVELTRIDTNQWSVRFEPVDARA
jgi:hypothetical protein